MQALCYTVTLADIVLSRRGLFPVIEPQGFKEMPISEYLPIFEILTAISSDKQKELSCHTLGYIESQILKQCLDLTPGFQGMGWAVV